MAANLPGYVAAAKPVPQDARVPWYSNIAPTYAGVMVWFAFWQNIPGFGETPGGMLSAGVGTALLAVIVSALVIHFLFYLVPGLWGMKTGLPLYVVGTSTYGANGSLYMPGFLMGVLQFFWLGFNAFFVADILCKCFGIGMEDATTVAVPGIAHGAIAVVFALLAAFVGLKGIQYVAKVATFFPLIPIVVLLILFFSTMGGIGKFDPQSVIASQSAAATADETDDEADGDGEDGAASDAATEKPESPASAKTPEANVPAPATAVGVILGMLVCIVGFFATAGAAGVDISMNGRNASDVQIGGLTGITLATIFSGCMAILVVVGYHGGTADIPAAMAGELNPINLMKEILGEQFANALFILLAISSFPAACFSSFIAANSFKTTLPKVDPMISVGIGAVVSCVLAVTGWAGNAAGVFGLIGASFGPVCGAMLADYLMAGGKWPGPRAGFNPAGWISWIIGFIVGAPRLFGLIPGLAWYKDSIPCPPMMAFLVGFVLYFVLAKAGLESEVLPMPGQDSADEG